MKTFVNPKEKNIQRKLQDKETIHKHVSSSPLSINNNRTGLPDNLKAGIENLSGMDMGDVKVHYNSAKPSQLNAHAYAQGTDIHIASGQERHLPHEAWHVVQQKQGRVKPTAQMKGKFDINGDTGLEKEADKMGQDALRNVSDNPKQLKQTGIIPDNTPYQLAKYTKDPKETKETKRQRFYNKIRKSNKRNRARKARPKRYRAMFNIQRDNNYGFAGMERHRNVTQSGDSQALVPYNPLMNNEIKPQHTQVDFGGVNTYFYKFFGGQPFFRLDTQSFDDPTIKSNYDDIISHFNGKDAEVAFDVLQTMETNKGLDSSIEGQARTLLIFLTQIIEAHDTRIPGADKLARALLRRIALGQLTFKDAFNRKNGLFVSAWSKSAGAKQGGQVAGRALYGNDKDKDKYDDNDLEKDLGDRMDELVDTVDYFSDDSDNEEEVEDYLPMKSNTIKSISDALNLFEISLSVSSMSDLLKLPTYEEEIKKAYRKLSSKYHPDKGENSDVEKFMEAAQASSILMEWVHELKENKHVDISGKELESIMHQNGLSLKKVGGDGNCFYAAILDQIGYHGGFVPSPQALRNTIAQLIIDNADTFNVFVAGNQLNQIVESILTNHSWNNAGGDFAPQLIATVLQRPVRIVQPDGVIDILPRNDLILNVNNTINTGNALISIVYNGNSHYDSTRQNMLR